MSTREPVHVVATASTLADLKNAIKDWKKTSFSKLYVTSRPGHLFLFFRYIQSALYNIKELIKSNKGDTIVYDFNNIFSTELINLLSKRVFKGRRIVIVCHSELEYLAQNVSKDPVYRRIMSWLTKRFFLHKNNRTLAPGLSFIVLGDVIKENLSNSIHPDLLKLIDTIDHPVIADNSDFKYLDKTNQKDINIGTVGILNRYKGAQDYIKLIKRLRDKKNVNFSIVGQIQDEVQQFKDLGVTMGRHPSEALPEAEFFRMIKQLDYILLLYPSNSYRLTASGALLDTLRFGRPVLALSNDYFKYFFEKFGPVGKLFGSLDELCEELMNKNEPEHMYYDFEGIINKLSPENLSPKFKAVLDKRAIK